jgi:hypothetical protein
MRNLLHSLTNRLRCRLIQGDNGEKYLERYFLFALGPRANPWMIAYIHRFVASDPDRGFHDHPWTWALSLILSGQYLEMVPRDGDITQFPVGRHKTPGAITTFGPNHKHRVELVSDECWTLFVHGRWIRPWGFYRCVFGQSPNGRASTAWLYEQYSDKCTAGWWRIAKTGKELRRLAAERKSKAA